jgi:hypothetical protein
MERSPGGASTLDPISSYRSFSDVSELFRGRRRERRLDRARRTPDHAAQAPDMHLIVDELEEHSIAFFHIERFSHLGWNRHLSFARHDAGLVHPGNTFHMYYQMTSVLRSILSPTLILGQLTLE